jgi:hypothetical protein
MQHDGFGDVLKSDLEFLGTTIMSAILELS